MTELEVDVQSFIHRNEFDSTSKVPFTSPRSVTQIALNSASRRRTLLSNVSRRKMLQTADDCVSTGVTVKKGNYWC